MAPLYRKCKYSARLDEKTAIVTGASSGIGKETALELLYQGARVIIACRNMKLGETVRRELQVFSGNENCALMKLNLSSLQSVREFAKEFQEKEDRLDILINNAGAMFTKYGETEDGFENNFAVNHLGHFLLTLLLLDKLKSSAPSRVINVTSRSHELAKMQWNDLMSEKYYAYFSAYQQSKLANVLFTRELARRTTGAGVHSYAVDPGPVNTDMWKNNSLLKSKFTQKITKLFIQTPREGAQTSVYCAVEPKLASHSGRYYSYCRERLPGVHARNDADARRLWELSLRYVRLAKDPTLSWLNPDADTFTNEHVDSSEPSGSQDARPQVYTSLSCEYDSYGAFIW